MCEHITLKVMGACCKDDPFPSLEFLVLKNCLRLLKSRLTSFALCIAPNETEFGYKSFLSQQRISFRRINSICFVTAFALVFGVSPQYDLGGSAELVICHGTLNFTYL